MTWATWGILSLGGAAQLLTHAGHHELEEDTLRVASHASNMFCTLCVHAG